MHLMLGNEILDVSIHDLSNDHLYLFARQKGFIQCQAKLASKMVIRPSSIRSKLHQKLTKTLASQSKKESRVKLVTTIVDPELDKAQKEKVEEDRIRAQLKLEAEQRNKAHKLGLDTRYLEEGEDDELDEDYNDSSGFVIADEEGRDEEQLSDKHRQRKILKPKKKRRERDEEVDAERLMNAKTQKIQKAEKEEKGEPEDSKEKKKKKVKSREKSPSKEKEPEQFKEKAESEEPPSQEDVSAVVEVADVVEEEEVGITHAKRKTKRVVVDDEAE